MPKRFYVAIVILLIAMMALSFLPVHGERDIYDTVVRLHVLANSDTEEDQSLKLKVRDSVLEAAAPYLEGCKTRDEAVEALTAHLAELETVASAVISSEGYDYPVTVLLGEEAYPTRVYESCAFPAGTYVSLRVLIGSGRGRTGGAVSSRPSACRRPPPKRTTRTPSSRWGSPRTSTASSPRRGRPSTRCASRSWR